MKLKAISVRDTQSVASQPSRINEGEGAYVNCVTKFRPASRVKSIRLPRLRQRATAARLRDAEQEAKEASP